jgi:hypothetical protein
MEEVRGAWCVVRCAQEGVPRASRAPRSSHLGPTLAATLIAMLAPLAAMPAQSPRLEIDVPPRVLAGEPVRIVLRATNDGAGPLELYLLGRSVTFDITVAGTDGAVVWRRLEGQIVPAILQIRFLAPGESLELEHAWDQRTNRGEFVGAGTYTVTGVIPTDSQPLRTPTAPLRIMPRER